MTDKKKVLLKKFVLKQIQGIGKNVSVNYRKNQVARTRNPFLCFSNSIDKFMGLGRSIDSQLGNRMQNITFYLCRIRYGSSCVPNIIVINANEATSKIEMKLFYTEGDLLLEKFYANKNPCQQKIYFNQELSDEKVKSIIGTKKNVNIIANRTLTFSATNELIDEIKTKGVVDWPVDLLFISEANDQLVINTFEIKMSGYIDTKNSESNANEVQRLFDVFKCSGTNASYFAVCYGECADAVKRRMKTYAPQGKTLTAEQFWNVVLPNTGAEALSYDEFIDVYKQAFVASKLEQTIKDL